MITQPAAHNLKRNSQLATVVASISSLLILLSCSAFAQSYALGWFTIDGGGGTSTGGVFMVSGTIGQPDAGMMSGGNFTLEGGFWSLFAIQTPGAPCLTLTRTATNTVVVSWPLPEAGWKLHAATNLVTAGGLWTEIPPPYQTNGAKLQFAEPAPLGSKFYRLHKP
jgi:hypothetical protein